MQKTEERTKNKHACNIKVKDVDVTAETENPEE
jgi:hypothetical protein